MLFKEAVGFLGKSAEFKKWHKHNKGCYLVHGFISIDDDNKWQIGYYDKKKDKITSFILGDKILIEPEQDVFKQEHKEVFKLEPGKVKVDFDKAVEIVRKFRQENYKAHPPIKRIFILQNIEIGQIWNITYITHSFNTLNFKVSSETGEILKHELAPLMQFQK